MAAASGSFAKFLPSDSIANTISILCGIASVYMLISGIISLGALKTLPRFGYGTIHELELEKKGASYLAEALVFQEKINIIRQLRNESSYQCLRNGFFVLLIALIISILAVVGEKMIPESNKNPENTPVVQSNEETKVKKTISLNDC